MRYIRYLRPYEYFYGFEEKKPSMLVIPTNTMHPISSDNKILHEGILIDAKGSLGNDYAVLFESKEALHTQLTLEKIALAEALDKAAIIQIRTMSFGYRGFVVYDEDGKIMELTNLMNCLKKVKSNIPTDNKRFLSSFVDFVMEYANVKKIPWIYTDNKCDFMERWKSKFELRNFPKSANTKKSSIVLDKRNFSIIPFMELLEGD